MIVPEQSKSASFVTLVEIHNVDVSVASNRNATVLSPTAGTPQWSSAIVVDFEIEFGSGSDSHVWHVGFASRTRLNLRCTGSVSFHPSVMLACYVGIAY